MGSGYLAEVDAAGMCDVVFTHKFKCLPAKQVATKTVCGLHQSALNVGTTTKEFFAPQVATMFRHAGMMREGDFWMRTILSIEVWADDTEIVPYPPGVCVRH